MIKFNPEEAMVKHNKEAILQAKENLGASWKDLGECVGANGKTLSTSWTVRSGSRYVPIAPLEKLADLAGVELSSLCDLQTATTRGDIKNLANKRAAVSRRRNKLEDSSGTEPTTEEARSYKQVLKKLGGRSRPTRTPKRVKRVEARTAVEETIATLQTATENLKKVSDHLVNDDSAGSHYKELVGVFCSHALSHAEAMRALKSINDDAMMWRNHKDDIAGLFRLQRAIGPVE